MKFLDKLSDQIEKYLAYIGFGIFFLCLWFAVEQVISRNAVRVTYNWAEEVICFAMLFSPFLVAALSTKYNSHIKIDILIANRTGRVKTVFDWFIPCVEFGTSIFLLYVYILHEIRLFKMGSVLVSGLPIPMWIAQMSLGLAFIFIAFFSGVKICRLFLGGK